jgi:4-oxalocrotonate tautomerase
VPLVNVHMATGRSPEQKKALMEAITQAVVDTIGAPLDTVRVWIDEFPATDYMAAGELLSDKKARMAAATEEQT